MLANDDYFIAFVSYSILYIRNYLAFFLPFFLFFLSFFFFFPFGCLFWLAKRLYNSNSDRISLKQSYRQSDTEEISSLGKLLFYVLYILITMKPKSKEFDRL